LIGWKQALWLADNARLMYVGINLSLTCTYKIADKKLPINSLISNFPTFLNQLWYFVCQRSKQNSEVSTYISSHSAITNLLSFAQFVAESFDGKIQVGIIITDFSKTFDRLDYYYVLLGKLHCRNYFWRKKKLWNVTNWNLYWIV
jgi:hypothetical protein